MRLVLASNSLAAPGGSETYLLTLGRHLQRFGHEVHVMEGPDGSGTLAVEAGLPTLRHPEELADPPDRIVVQDAIVAGVAASAWPTVPQLFVVHSSLHDLQLTSAVPSSVARYLVLNDLTGDRARALPPTRPVSRLTQPIDVGHFTPGPPPRPVPEVLLLFGNNKAAWRYEGLEAACAERGIEVRRAGVVGGELVRDPVSMLREADIVVGYGRCILEAMACGRTAFVYDRFGSDGWVTAATYPALEATGFSGAAGLDEPGRRDFLAVLDAYDPATGAEGHDLAFRHHHARTHAVEVLGLLDALGPVEPADPSLAFSLARVWREAWRWEVRALAVTGELDALRQELDRQRGALADLQAAGVAREVEVAAQVDRLEAQLADALARLDAVLRSRRYRVGGRLARLVGRGDGGMPGGDE